MSTTQPTKKAAPKRKGLAAPLDAHSPGVDVLRAYWIGAFPGCVGEGLSIAGVNFPKINEDVKRNSGAKGGTQRIPRLGALVRLDHAKVELIRARLLQQVIRFTEVHRPEEFITDSHGDEKRVGHQTDAMDYDQPRRKGRPIRIPTETELENARKAGRPLRKYTRGTHDEPAARYLFAQLCTNQEKPVRGEAYPPSLEDADIEWPEEK